MFLALSACLAPGDRAAPSGPAVPHDDSRDSGARDSGTDDTGAGDTDTTPKDDTGRDTGDTGVGAGEDTAPCPPSWLDADADGFGAGAPLGCDAPEGHATVGGDCDDADAAVFPGALEVCDAVDQDCDGFVDDHAVDATTRYADRDGDGAGDGETAIVACDVGGVDLAGDCDDADPDIGPHGTEICEDGVDQDCDGTDRTCLWMGTRTVTDADATFTGDATNMDLGEQLVDAGDLDGDGFSEVVLAAAGTSSSRSAGTGSVWIFAGGAALAGDTRATALAELNFDGCLDDVAPAGDLDGDGFGDLLVGQSCAGVAREGAAHLYYGGPARLRSDASSRGDAVFEGAIADGLLGAAVSAAGDVDGDGLDDLLLADATSVYLGYGDASRSAGAVAASSLASWAGSAAASPGGDAAGLTAGDLDGDGLRDLLAFERDGRSSGADVPGEVHVLYGDVTRHAGAARLADWDASFVGPAGAGTVGLGEVTLAGDLDGDGYDDVAAGSSTHESSRGTVWVFAGGAARYAGDVPDTDADHRLQGAAAFAAFASSVALVPDLDGYDGAELLVGARGTGAWLFRGGARSGTYDTASADASFGGAPYVDDLGEAVAAPDLDGDGIPELLVGAPDTNAGEGVVYVFLGASM